MSRLLLLHLTVEEILSVPLAALRDWCDKHARGKVILETIRPRTTAELSLVAFQPDVLAVYFNPEGIILNPTPALARDIPFIRWDFKEKSLVRLKPYTLLFQPITDRVLKK